MPAADPSPFSPVHGPHSVGVQIVQHYDHTRLYRKSFDRMTGEPTQGERARPLQTMIWYPAVIGGTPITYRHYLETVPTEDDFTRSDADIQRMTEERIDSNAGSRRDAVLEDVALPMRAVLDAPAAIGPFPVVLYAPGFSGFAMENADLCEYLASHGYVVISSPSLGRHSRPMTLDLEGLETQASDLAYLIGFASTQPQADTTRVGVIGFSWGGLANVIAAAEDERIKALVSLDGSLRYYPEFVDGGQKAVKSLTPAQVTAPLLYLGARPKTIEELNREETSTRYSFMNEMNYSDVYIFSLLPLRHAHFSSFALRMAQEAAFGDFTRDEVTEAHRWVACYTRSFLDAYLKDDATGLAFLNNPPAANQIPAQMMITDIRRKQTTLAPTLDNFIQRLAADGFDNAIDVYKHFAQQGAVFTLEPHEVYGWGAHLYRLSRSAQAREIFRLGTHLHPKQSSLYEALAEMQVKTGQPLDAAKSYRRVLELDPENVDALQFLKAER